MDVRRLGPETADDEQNAVIAEVIERALAAGHESVQRGPDLLPVLREAGVVDAGGYALTVLLAGIVGALRGSEPPEIEHQAAARVTHPQHESSTFRYCTNFAVTGSGLEPRRFIAELEAPRGLGARRRRPDDAQDPCPHRRPRRGDRRVRRGRDRVSSRRRRHARPGPPARRAPGGADRAGDVRGVGGHRRRRDACPVREPRRARPRRGPDAQPVDLRPAGRHPRRARRAGRGAGQQPQRRDGRRARGRAVGQARGGGALALPAGRSGRRGQPRPDAGAADNAAS